MIKSDLTLANGKTLPFKDGVFQACVTSPPYYGLRDYQTATWVGGDPDCEHVKDAGRTKVFGNPEFNENRPSRDLTKLPGYHYEDVCGDCGAQKVDIQVGLEQSVEEYIEALVEIFREVRRVLRSDGTLWVNIGDSYNGSGGSTTTVNLGRQYDGKTGSFTSQPRDINGLQSGDLVGVPWMLAFALQRDGWILRKDNIWVKKSWMPESMKGWRWEQHRVKIAGRDQKQEKYLRGPKHSGNEILSEAKYMACPGCEKCEANGGLILKKGQGRTTTSKEYIFQFTKSEEYYYDEVAVQEVAKYDGRKATMMQGAAKYEDAGFLPDHNGQTFHERGHERWPNKKDGVPMRNRRDCWSDIAPFNFKGGHFAPFPPDLPRICIEASTSERGQCPICGSPWARVAEREFIPQEDVSLEKGVRGANGQNPHADAKDHRQGTPRGRSEKKSLGWLPTCEHKDEKPVPQLVLDVFGGSGTTPMVAQELGRRGVYTDIKLEYALIAQQRCGITDIRKWTEGIKDQNDYEFKPEVATDDGQITMFGR